MDVSAKSTVETLTYAQAAATALATAMDADPRIVALGEDLGRGGVFGQYTLDGQPLATRFGPERIIDTPISEANIMGAAVGMALAGLKPVVEMRVIDFALCGMDELVNQAAKNRYMFGGQGRVPLVVRMPIGIWTASAAQHSQSLEAWFAHLPGVVVVCPGTPQDNHGLLASALACGDPVVYLEHKELWSLRGEVDRGLDVPLGRARIARAGRDLTLVTWSRTLQESLKAAEELAREGIDVEVIDLRTLWPWDRETVLASAARTQAPAGRARGGAGRRLRRRGGGDGRRGTRLPGEAARLPAHPGRLRAHARSRGARRRAEDRADGAHAGWRR